MRRGGEFPLPEVPDDQIPQGSPFEKRPGGLTPEALPNPPPRLAGEPSPESLVPQAEPLTPDPAREAGSWIHHLHPSERLPTQRESGAGGTLTWRLSDGSMLVQRLAVDQDGQPILVQETLATKPTREGSTRRTTTFDAAGQTLSNEVEVADRNGRPLTREVFDAEGRLTARAVFSYDRRGRWTSHTSRFDEAGRAVGGSVVTGNRQGRILSREDFDSQESAPPARDSGEG